MDVVAAEAVPGARPWKAALGWLLFLGPFFFATYGFANWIASTHTIPGVRVVVFDWERHIPFLPWTIAPYWSIDFLYGLSLFLCASRAELGVHVRRLIAAQTIAVGCFLLVPLRFSFARPETDGAFGWMFAALETFDQPFNQAPSLHIALLIILWGVYLRVIPRVWHAPLLFVFVLIGVSVLTTWQHHFIDIPTGAWLGWFCVWLFPDGARSPLAGAKLTRDTARCALAWRYALGALAFGILAIAASGVWLWLLWPAGAVALVALTYAMGDERAFQKRADGSIAPAAWWLMGPYFVGAWLNSRWWTRRLSAADTIVPGVLLGRIPTRRELARLRVGAIIDLSAELPCAAGSERYVNVPVLDLIAPSVAQLERAAAAIESARGGGPVLVCCALGFSRSAAAVAAWLVRAQIAPSIDAALTVVRRSRSSVVLGPTYLAALRAWQEKKGSASNIRDIRVTS